MRLTLAVMALALLAASCDAEPATTTVAADTGTNPNIAAPVDGTADPADSTVDPPCVAGDEPFATSGFAGTFGASTGDAAQLEGLRWTTHDVCERVVIDLVSRNGAPASSLGPGSVSFRSELGVVRIELPPEIDATAFADRLVDASIVDRVFVVRTLDGELAVDLHLATESPVAVRATALVNPSRIAVDIALSIEGSGRIAAPTVSPGIVTLSPLGGPAEYPITVNGYSSPSSSTVVARLSGGDDDLVETRSGPPSQEAWTEFEMIHQEGPTGEVTLFVGDEANEPAGATIHLDLS